MKHATTIHTVLRLLLSTAAFFAALCTTGPAAQAQWVRMNNLPAGYNDNHWLDVFFLPSDPRYGWICGYRSFVLRTTDGGQSWQGVTTDNNMLQLESIHFVSPQIGYTSGGGRILKTVDGGQSWFDVSPATPLASSLWGCYFVSADTGVVIGGGCFDSRQYFFRTTNGGQSWTRFVGSLPNSGLTDAMLYSASGLGYASSSGAIWQTDDGGISWELFAQTGTADWQEEITNIKQSFLVPVSGSPCGGDEARGGIRMTTDNGRTWRRFLTGANMYGTFLLDTLRGWACGSNGSAYYTPDGGVTWRKRDCGIVPTEDLDDIWMINDTLGWVVGNGVYRLSTRAALPTHLAVEGDTALCEGETTVIHAPAGYFSYLWSTGDTTRSITVTATGDYYAVATDELGCPYDFDTVRVVVQPTPRPAIAALGPVDFCVGDSVELNATSGFASYRWSTGDTTRSIVVRASGVYSVQVLSDAGCSGTSATIAVDVRPANNQLVVRTDARGIVAFDTTNINGRFCRSITVVNTSATLAFVIDSPVAFFLNNVNFSLPPGQFPMTIQPLDSVQLVACYTPSHPSVETDTLYIIDNCSTKQAVVQGSGGTNIYNVEGRCNTSLTLRTVAYDSFVLRLHPPAPNPASTVVRVPVTFKASEPDIAQLRCTLYNEFGTPVVEGFVDGLSTTADQLTYGEFVLDIANTSQGVYFIHVRTPYGSSVLTLVVQR